MSHGNKTPTPPPANPAIQVVNTPTAFETIAADRLKKYNDWETSPSAHDITQAPGMGDMIDIYGTADAAAQKKRLGNPMRALAGEGSAGYATQLEQLGKQQRFDQTAEGLSHGLQSLKSEAYGLGGSAADLETNRKKSYADLMLSQQEQYYNRPKPVPLWQKIAGVAIGGLGALGTAGGSAGLKGL